MFEKFRKAQEFLIEVEGYNLNLGFEKDIQKSIEEQVCRKIGLSEEVTKIANIQLGFENGGLLRLLEKRAAALKKANFVKVRDINDEMTKYKDEHFQKLTTPNSAYCTFARAEAFQAVLKHDKESRKEQ